MPGYARKDFDTVFAFAGIYVIICLTNIVSQALFSTSILPSVVFATAVILITALTLIAGAELFHILKTRDRKLSPLSIKESLDHLPTGICFYWDGGLTKLTNLKMDSISRRLLGENAPSSALRTAPPTAFAAAGELWAGSPSTSFWPTTSPRNTASPGNSGRSRSRPTG